MHWEEWMGVAAAYWIFSSIVGALPDAATVASPFWKFVIRFLNGLAGNLKQFAPDLAGRLKMTGSIPAQRRETDKQET